MEASSHEFGSHRFADPAGSASDNRQHIPLKLHASALKNIAMENLHSTEYSTSEMRFLKLSVLALFLAELPAFAQAQPDTGEPVTMKMLSSSPQPGERGVQATIGGSQQSGSSNSQGVSVQLIAAHTTNSGDLVRFDADYTLARYKQVETAPWFKVQDDMVVQNVYLHLFE